MKTHEHALVSVAYGVLVAGAAGRSLVDPTIYLATVFGGEIVDFLDHPLYHLVYGRNDPAVVEVRRTLRDSGIRRAWRVASQYEDERKFTGLAMHKLPFMIVLAAACAVVAFTGASLFVDLALGALLLHLASDLVGDIVSVGHADNWSRSLPGRMRRFLLRKPSRVCAAVVGLAAFLLSCLILISVAAAATDGHHRGLAELATPVSRWLTYALLTSVSAYIALMTLMVWLTAQVYRIDFGPADGKARLLVSVGSVSQLKGLLTGRIAKTSREFERLLLMVQADQLVWALIVGVMLAAALTILDVFGLLSNYVLLLVPLIVAIVLNTFVHSTIGELGASSGVVLSWWVNIVLGRLHLIPLWGHQRVLAAGVAAVGSMAIALMGGIVLRGRVRMSAVCFGVRLTPTADSTNASLSLDAFASDRLDRGYGQARRMLKAKGVRPGAASVTSPETVFNDPGQAGQVTVDEVCHARISDVYSPIVRELITLVGGDSGSICCTPILPRHRVAHSGPAWPAEVVRTGGVYRWRQKGLDEEIRLPGVPGQDTDGATKTRSEFLDNLVTRSTEIVTDLFLRIDPDRAGDVLCWGIVREATSTKEYATIEAELYASSVAQELQIDGWNVSGRSLARASFTRASIFDLALVDATVRDTTFKNQMSEREQDTVSLYIDALDRTNTGGMTTAVAAISRRKLVAFAFQVAAGTALAALGLHKL